MVGWERFRGNELSTAGGEGGGVTPWLGGVVQQRDAFGGDDLEPPVGVQDEPEALGVDEGVVPGADEHEIARPAADVCARLRTDT